MKINNKKKSNTSLDKFLSQTQEVAGVFLLFHSFFSSFFSLFFPTHPSAKSKAQRQTESANEL